MPLRRALQESKGRLELCDGQNCSGKTERSGLLAALTPATKQDARQRTRMTAVLKPEITA